MKKTWSALFLCVCLFAASGSRSEGFSGSPEWVFPGEYESHQAMWMLWPTFEYKAGFPSTEPMADMIRAMSGHVQVNLAVQDAADEADARGTLAARGVPLGHVHFFHIEHGDIWARDMGPQFTRNSSGNLRINDWNFNMWGYEEPDSDFSTLEEAVDRTVADAIDVPVLDAQAGPSTGPGHGLHPAEHLRAEPGLACVQGPRRERVSTDAGRPEGHPAGRRRADPPRATRPEPV